MFEIPLEKLIEKIGNKYLVALTTARRAQMIKEGSYPLIEGPAGDDPLTVVLREILANKIKIEIKAAPEKKPTPLEEHFPLAAKKAAQGVSIKKEVKPKKKKADKKKKKTK